jgi:membrane protein DedA with SNARE-associated domain
LTFIGSWLWSYLLVAVGWFLGDNWELLRPLWHKFDIFIVVSGAIAVVAYIWHHWRSTAPRQMIGPAAATGPLAPPGREEK